MEYFLFCVFLPFNAIENFALFYSERICIKINELSCKCSAATWRTNIKSTLSTHIHSNGNVCSKSLMMFAVCFFVVVKMIPKQRVTEGTSKEPIFHLKLLICIELRAYSISYVEFLACLIDVRVDKVAVNTIQILNSRHDLFLLKHKTYVIISNLYAIKIIVGLAVLYV